jgi:hypothetical protein
LISDSVIKSDGDSARCEVVPLRIPVAVHIDKIAEASDPHAPTIFWGMLKDWFHDRFGVIFAERIYLIELCGKLNSSKVHMAGSCIFR